MRHSKRKQKKHISFWAIPCAAALLVAMAVWHLQPSSEGNLEFIETKAGELDNPFAKSMANPFPEANATKRLVYPYSVVAGGVHRPDELRRAVARDRVVAAHYSDFDVSRARVVKLSAAKTAYVSYRMKNRVYWTKKKVTLAKGETLITDGKNYARTRCANRVSDSAQAAVSPQEPSPVVIDTPVASSSAALMAYLPSAVRQGLAPDSLGGSGTGGGSQAGNEGGRSSGGAFGGPGYGGGAFLPAAGGSGGAGASGGGNGGGGTPGNGTPGDVGGAPAGGTGSGTPGNSGTVGGSSGSNPPVSGTSGSGTETLTPGEGNGNTNGNGSGGNPPSQVAGGNGSSPNGNPPGDQPSNGGGSTPPNQGGGPGNSSSPGDNPFAPPGKGSDPDFTPPPQGGGSTPPPSNPNGPGNPFSPEESTFTPSDDEDGEPPVDVTTPPNEGGPNPTPPTAPVPEPASIWLLSAGAASLLALRKRKK